MLEGKCQRCGLTRYGWALLNPRYQTCATCGIGLQISENGHVVMKGFSPFEAERMDTIKAEDGTETQKNSEST